MSLMCMRDTRPVMSRRSAMLAPPAYASIYSPPNNWFCWRIRSTNEASLFFPPGYRRGEGYFIEGLLPLVHCFQEADDVPKRDRNVLGSKGKVRIMDQLVH